MEAKKLYKNRRRDIDALLDLIGQEVLQHAEAAEIEGGPNWAHCGDLSYVREHLTETLAFLAGQDVEFVEETLGDIAASDASCGQKRNVHQIRVCRDDTRFDEMDAVLDAHLEELGPNATVEARADGFYIDGVENERLLAELAEDHDLHMRFIR